MLKKNTLCKRNSIRNVIIWLWHCQVEACQWKEIKGNWDEKNTNWLTSTITNLGREKYDYTLHFLLSHTQRESLRLHISKFHEGARPFSCAHPGCMKTFSYKKSLVQHQVVHEPGYQKPPAKVLIIKPSIYLYLLDNRWKKKINSLTFKAKHILSDF